MSEPYYTDDQTTLWLGDALDVLRTLPDASVDCCVTSPPYFGLRDYGVAGQIGAEASPSEFVAALVAVFAEVRRVLADDGTLWLNLGDSYYSGRGNPGPNSDDKKNVARRGWTRAIDKPGADWAQPKSLIGIPWRTAFALQDDRWILRNDIIWAKPNGMPESVTDRLSTKHEHLFLFAQSRRYWFNLDAIREPAATMQPENPGFRINGKSDRRRKAHAAPPGQSPQTNLIPTGTRHSLSDELGRNPGDVWTIPTQPFSEAHFAVFPLKIPRRAIAAGCKPGGVVLDPFSGSGTTGKAAAELGRRYVGIDLNAEYLDLSLRTRLAQPSLTAEGGAA